MRMKVSLGSFRVSREFSVYLDSASRSKHGLKMSLASVSRGKHSFTFVPLDHVIALHLMLPRKQQESHLIQCIA